mmetsp:Transcript_27042/g.44636  ORF Transcript_27042/g.44636 Transcript_27042/m.44636 type:complete len:238 (+) Transcript_27042:1-714(+)
MYGYPAAAAAPGGGGGGPSHLPVAHGGQRELAAAGDHHALARLPRAAAHRLDRLHHIHTLHNLAENNMLAVKPRGLYCGDEKLRAICVGPRIRHAQVPGAFMLHREVLILEFASIYALTASTSSMGEIAALDHEIRNNTVECGTFIVQRLSIHRTFTLFPSAQGPEIFHCLRDCFSEQTHDNSASRLASNLDIKVNLIGDFSVTLLLGLGLYKVRSCHSKHGNQKQGFNDCADIHAV